jgi:hypothetical protein
MTLILNLKLFYFVCLQRGCINDIDKLAKLMSFGDFAVAGKCFAGACWVQNRAMDRTFMLPGVECLEIVRKKTGHQCHESCTVLWLYGTALHVAGGSNPDGYGALLFDPTADYSESFRECCEKWMHDSWVGDVEQRFDDASAATLSVEAADLVEARYQAKEEARKQKLTQQALKARETREQKKRNTAAVERARAAQQPPVAVGQPSSSLTAPSSSMTSELPPALASSSIGDLSFLTSSTMSSSFVPITAATSTSVSSNPSTAELLRNTVAMLDTTILFSDVSLPAVSAAPSQPWPPSLPTSSSSSSSSAAAAAAAHIASQLPMSSIQHSAFQATASTSSLASISSANSTSAASATSVDRRKNMVEKLQRMMNLSKENAASAMRGRSQQDRDAAVIVQSEFIQAAELFD